MATMEISDEQINAAYEVAKLAYARSLSATDGARRLHAQNAMNEGTARLYIDVFRAFMQGAEHKRSLSINATRVYFTRILADFGQESLALAIQATQVHLAYLLSSGESNAPALRQLVNEFESRSSIDEVRRWAAKLNEAVSQSMLDSHSARARRLRAAPPMPQRIRLETWQYARNPDVIAEVLFRANGRCEKCANPAPFERRSNGSPYLEVHHTIQLANGGPDIVDNAIALCPNCHRQVHFGRLDA